MKKNVLRAAEACLFVALTVCVLLSVTHLMERKASTNQFGPFLEEPNAYDVLFFGDSTLVNCMFPMELWNDYGISGYNLASYGNTMPVTYWAIMNALDYAQPKLIVLAVNDVRKDLKVTGNSSDVHTAFDFYPLSRTKIAAIEDLMSDPTAKDDEGNYYADMKWEYYFTLGKYHSRWSELTLADVKVNPNVLNGAQMKVGVAQPQEYDLIDGDLYDEEAGVGYSYLRRIIEEVSERNIDILLVHLPHPASENAQRSANTVGNIAYEYDVRYVDFVSLDSVVDYMSDCFDAHSHLNPSGAQKFTDYLGQYIVDHYDIADHRSDPAYGVNDRRYVQYLAHKRDTICDAQKLEDLLMLLHDDSFSADIAVREQAQLYWNDQQLTLMHNIVREHVKEEEEYSAWSNAMFPLDGLEDALWNDDAYFLQCSGTMFSEAVGSEAKAQAEAAFGADVWDEGKEIRIRVWDQENGEMIADRQF